MNKDLDKQFEDRNIKPTANRQLILQILTDQNSAISLPELEVKLETIDKATIYRNLKTFEHNGLIHSIDDGSGSLKYALCKVSCNCKPEDLHVHFMCYKCKTTYCLHNTAIPQFELPTGFSLESVNMVVKGICVNCKT